MTTTLRICFIPLTDCAPLVVAKEKGFFGRHGLEVELLKAQTWDQIISRLTSGDLDAAHMLVTIPLQWALGLSGHKDPMVYAVALSQHGNAITLSNELWREGVRDALTLKTYLASRKSEKPLQFAVVYPRSTHEYVLRLWLQRGGLELGKDVALRYVAPPEMVHQLREGGIDGFCVGEPWNQRAVNSKLGYIVATSCDLLPPMNEKVLAMRAAWHRDHVNVHAALIQSILEAADWLGDPVNRENAVDLVAGKRYVNTSREPIRAALFGEIQAGGKRILKPNGFLRFCGEGANYPDPNHARFYLEQMWRSGHIDPVEAQSVDLESICLDGFYRECLKKSGVPTIGKLPEAMNESYTAFLERFPKS